MSIKEPETPYSRLYIDTHKSQEATQGLLDQILSTVFGALRVDATVFKNHAYEPARAEHLAYHPIFASIWTAEVDAEKNDADSFEVFQTGLIKMIRALRATGMRVTASCDFEERVAEETGWNWTAETPEPPE